MLHQLLPFASDAILTFFFLRPMFSHMINTQFEELRKGDRNWKHRTAQEKQVPYRTYLPKSEY